MPQHLLLHEAVIYVLQQQGKDLTVDEITEQIKMQNLYVDEKTGISPTTTEVTRRISGATYKDEVFIRKGNLVTHRDIDDIRLMRLTWNTNGWQEPITHKWSPKRQGTKAAFENQYGLGFEEWLFNPAFLLNGYQYGLIRGAEDIKNLHTIIREVYLFTINQNTHERFLVGIIKNLEPIATYSLGYSQVRPLFKLNKKMMAQHLKKCDADLKGLELATNPCVP